MLHEVGHVLLHPRRESFLDLDDQRDRTDPAELEADTFANNLLFPEGSSAEIAHASTIQDLIVIAARLGIGVPTVAGNAATSPASGTSSVGCDRRSPRPT
ncbi:ImmA/IrrE family metallo-endopeptidase [Dactylosporangium sp. NPDC049525]|uniref:ImmA/IrrE family metallo-endopeptidase n=1 Tax=Dactylosporangium sp. NPDC049525 TaxID=3154730 RepID=UPI00342EB974